MMMAEIDFFTLSVVSFKTRTRRFFVEVDGWMMGDVESIRYVLVGCAFRKPETSTCGSHPARKIFTQLAVGFVLRQRATWRFLLRKQEIEEFHWWTLIKDLRVFGLSDCPILKTETVPNTNSRFHAGLLWAQTDEWKTWQLKKTISDDSEKQHNNK